MTTVDWVYDSEVDIDLTAAPVTNVAVGGYIIVVIDTDTYRVESYEITSTTAATYDQSFLTSRAHTEAEVESFQLQYDRLIYAAYDWVNADDMVNNVRIGTLYWAGYESGSSGPIRLNAMAREDYESLGGGLALGETSSTAYRGDRGKTAWDHSQVVTGNPHGTAIGDISGLQTAIDAKAPLASPTFTGTPAAPTPSANDNSTKLATTAYVDANKQPLDADLTTIAGLTPTTDSFMQAKAGAWAARTIAQVKTDLGISSPPLFITPAINDYVGMPSPNVAAHGIANYVLGATGRGNISPIWLPGATYDRIGVYVQSGGTATLRLGLYTADATTGLPGTKVFDAGTISTASTGLIEATISQTLAAGWYWAAVVNDAHTSTFDLMGWSDSTAPTIFGSALQTSVTFRQRVALASSSWTTGGLTTSPPTLEWQAAGVKVVLRRSA